MALSRSTEKDTRLGGAPAGYIDLEHGTFYRRPAGAVETKKTPSAPRRLLAYLRRWKRRGQRFVERASKRLLAAAVVV